jgi:hypothetical protein
MAAASSVWLRRGAVAVAAGRAGIGITALACPGLLARPWVGAAAAGAPVRVLSRALAGRDLVLGLGALAALWRCPPAASSVPAAGLAGSAGAARTWVEAGALSDAIDVVSTAACWGELPARSRYLVAASAAGAAVVGAAAAVVLARQHASDAGCGPAPLPAQRSRALRPGERPGSAAVAGPAVPALVSACGAAGSPGAAGTMQHPAGSTSLDEAGCHGGRAPQRGPSLTWWPGRGRYHPRSFGTAAFCPPVPAFPLAPARPVVRTAERPAARAMNPMDA